MINCNDKKQWVDGISELMETPVSEKYFDFMTEKQRFAVYNSLSMGDGALAKTILNQIKSKISPHKGFKYQPTIKVF